jgi:hypothetical protein
MQLFENDVELTTERLQGGNDASETSYGRKILSSLPFPWLPFTAVFREQH